MRIRIRAAVMAALVLLAAASVASPEPASAAAKKVAIIVGPVGSLTSTYRSMADKVATAASAAGATVVKVYSPSATWANVKAAVNGANVVVYFGHGNGYPNPYTIGTEYTDRVNGWGLNSSTANGDADSWSNGTLVYCGEKALLGTLTSSDGAYQRQYCGQITNTDGITPAPGFTMVYAQAHYAPGFGERYVQTTPLTTLSEAQQRVANYSTPILALGGTYIATAYSDANEIVGRVLNQPSTTFGDIFRAGDGYSPSTLTDSAHPAAAGSRVWVQRTTISGFHFGEPDYWYAFAGDPNRTPGGGAASGVPITRLAGSDRYGTAAAISAANYSPGVPVAYVATGANYPDALAGGSAGKVGGGPILLITRDSIPTVTAVELGRLRPARIVVLGGPDVVSEPTLNALGNYTGGGVYRQAGADRYATAAAISAALFAPNVAVAYVATGADFPDALAAGAAAARANAPLLLVTANGVPQATAGELARLHPAKIVVVGNEAAVGAAVFGQLASFAPTVQRVAGSDRFETPVQLSRATFAAGSAATAFIATADQFPDGLAVGPLAGRLGGPLLLVGRDSVPAGVIAELQRLNPSRVVIVGGPAAVSEYVRAQIQGSVGN